MQSGRIPPILVVDDERTIASSLTSILNMSGYRARFFINPVEALVPELSGVDLAIRLKELCPSCKVLLFSGQAATTDLLREARGGSKLGAIWPLETFQTRSSRGQCSGDLPN
jgi:FixJ family two-component response regulator